MSRFLDLQETLLGCLTLTLADHPNVPAEICLRAGDVAYDIGPNGDLCCSGLAWVKLRRYFQSDSLPNPITTDAKCNHTRWALELEMGVLRCYPSGDAEGNPPSCAEHEAAVVQLDEDAQAMRQALCCFRGTPFAREVVAGEYTTDGPLGGCIAGIQPLFVLLDCSECTT
jgi:hypothetical protein